MEFFTRLQFSVTDFFAKHFGHWTMPPEIMEKGDDLYIIGNGAGDIVQINQRIVIEPGVIVHGQISGLRVAIYGRVQGRVHAEEEVTLLPGGILVGDIIARRFIFEDGSRWYNGEFKMLASGEKT